MQIADPAALEPPFVNIPGLSNFRDIGGWPIKDQNGNTIATVRKGIFYRGPDTAAITDEGVVKLRCLNITTDFDLRSKGQIEKAGGFKQLDGIERISCPAFPDGEYSPDKAAARYVQYASDGTDVGGFSRVQKQAHCCRESFKLSPMSSLMEHQPAER